MWSVHRPVSQAMYDIVIRMCQTYQIERGLESVSAQTKSSWPHCFPLPSDKKYTSASQSLRKPL
jgi:hypothetical protein